jgi:ribosomal protein S18 acetylase RimI-like enzyme
MAIELHTLTSATLDAADAVLVAAYGGTSRRARLANYLRLQPGGWVLAEFDGAVAGVAGATNYGPFAYIGLVGVSPAYQRRGVALAMMHYLLGWLAANGNPPVMLDASPAGAPLYEKLGFADDDHTVSFVRDKPAPLPPHAPAVRRLAPEDLPAVAAFDAPIFGADRSAVLKLLLNEIPQRAFVLHDPGGAVSGYLFAQDDKLGPWAAATPTAAEALLGAALTLDYAAGPYVLATSSNTQAAALLRRYGFSATRALRHMRLGGEQPPGQLACMYGRASFAIG